ncbi:hypothetical protein [Castellaniella sp.]|uniref:hypothetical protein n=1 Tax=Castellaniella sp. TaxID=1955812 RepID=UPI002AFFDCCD|nr:hypothetical protein [Castellaniella sp.]
MAKNANLLTIFAEDVRQEVNGQISIIGVFDDELVISKYPTTIPKICLLSTISTLIDDPMDIASFRVFFENGETLISSELPPELSTNRKAIISQTKDIGDYEWMFMRVQVEMSNLRVDQDSTLRAEIVGSDGSVATSNSLKIILREPQKRTPSITL